MGRGDVPPKKTNTVRSPNPNPRPKKVKGLNWKTRARKRNKQALPATLAQGYTLVNMKYRSKKSQRTTNKIGSGEEHVHVYH